MTSHIDLKDAYRMQAEEVLAVLGTDVHNGLSQTEARARLETFGRNELIGKKRVPPWRKFLAQFQDALVILLLVATIISTALWLYEGDSALPYEAMAIFAVVLLNATMGFVQQARAEEALAAIREMAATRANVIREGVRQSVPAPEVVPGDILLIGEGDSISADARLLQTTLLQVAEASLTGESLTVNKDTHVFAETVSIGDRTNMVYSGTSATYGRGQALVVATGMNTEMGQIAQMLESAPDETSPLQKELARIGKLLGLFVIIIAVVMIVTILLFEDIQGFAAFFDVLILGVALAVAAVPEGLPAVVAAVLSLGVQRMAKRKAIVRHLAAVETLGSASVIASDKTGTLTMNEMTVRTIITASGQVVFGGTGYTPVGEMKSVGGQEIEPRVRLELTRALTAADRANNAVLQQSGESWSIQGDPTEGALIVAARKAGLDSRTLDVHHIRLAEVPFSSERKLMSTVHTDITNSERVLVFTKGAPDVLLMHCSHELVGEEYHPLSEKRRSELLTKSDELASDAMRTLGVAFRYLPKDSLDHGLFNLKFEEELTFLALIGMIDPPRIEAKKAVSRAISAGIRPIMITGDHPRTANVIATELGISNNGRVVA